MALDYNPQGTKKLGLPKTTWRTTITNEGRTTGKYLENGWVYRFETRLIYYINKRAHFVIKFYSYSKYKRTIKYVQFGRENCLITGAANGIGFAYAKELLRNKLKAVALVDIDNVKGQHALNEIIQEFGRNCAIFVKADVTNKMELEGAFETTVKTFNQLDIVINNAGIAEMREWEKCIAINLVGVIYGSMLAMEKYLPKYRSGSEGMIINTASLAGLQPIQESPVYSATKSGVIAFTIAMGGKIRYETSQVKVLAICPGIIETDLIQHLKNRAEGPYETNFVNMAAEAPTQTPEALVKSVMEIIAEAPTGSIWLAMRGCCTKVEFPQFE